MQMRFIDSYAGVFFREQAVRILVENESRSRRTVRDGISEWDDNPHPGLSRKSAGTGDPATHE